MSYLAKLTASGLGSGFLPVAPGTWGSLVGGLIIYANSLVGAEYFQPVLLAVLLAFLVFGYFSITYLPGDWEHDDSRIVIDEIIGMLVSFIFLPFTWTNLVMVFLFFRLFDIVKPFGIRSLEKIGGPWGVLIDDIGAGVYTNITVRIILLLLYSL